MAKKKVAARVVRPSKVKIGSLEVWLSEKFGILTQRVGPPPPPPGWRAMVVFVRTKDVRKVTSALRGLGVRT